jgi:uncharacterized protein
LVNARRLIFTTAGTLRAPWRLLLFVAALVAAVLVTQSLFVPVLLWLFRGTGLRESSAYFAQLIAALLATWLTLRVIDRKPWSDVGLHREALAPRRVGLAFLIGGGAIAIATIILIGAGWLDRQAGTTSQWSASLFRMALLLIPAALGEELIARGYALAVLRDAVGWKWAVAITSAFFGLMHMQNPGASAQSVVIVALAGVFLAVIRIGTDSLYAAWAAHFAWNWVMAALFHTPVSGYAFDYPAYRYVDAGPDWATGGSWGPESGLPAGLMMIVGTGLLLRMSSRARARDLHREKKDG